MKTVRRIRRTVDDSYSTFDELVKDSARLVVGIDPSLSGTGIAAVSGSMVIDYYGWTTKKTEQKRNSRLSWMKFPAKADERDRVWRTETVAGWVSDVVLYLQRKYRKDAFIALEGYSFNSRSSRASDIHELCGLIKLHLWREEIPVRIYPPSTLKMAVTGRGDADKGDMKIACFRKFNLEVTEIGSAGENIADAVLLAGLLSAELAIRDGRMTMEDLDAHARRALLHTTKKEPEAIISRPFLLRGNGFTEPPTIIGGDSE
jgi:Holliday junction resolvasome RuvABC endonuclease subunit